jgi:deoxyribonuclease V
MAVRPASDDRSAGARPAVVAADAAFSDLAADRVRLVPGVEPYQPGQFCLSELPPLRAVPAGLTGMALLMAGGYADLDPDGPPGLGARVHAEFAVPVIGVAKSAFRTATHALPVLRGASARPLYVTAAGMPGPTRSRYAPGHAGQHRLQPPRQQTDTTPKIGHRVIAASHHGCAGRSCAAAGTPARPPPRAAGYPRASPRLPAPPTSRGRVCTGGTGFRHPQLEPRTVRIVSIYGRGPDGRLAAVRVYDDVEAPAGSR